MCVWRVNYPILFFEHHRGLYIIDKSGILRQITINDLPVGRSVEETLRLVQVCPNCTSARLFILLLSGISIRR